MSLPRSQHNRVREEFEMK